MLVLALSKIGGEHLIVLDPNIERFLARSSPSLEFAHRWFIVAVGRCDYILDANVAVVSDCHLPIGNQRNQSFFKD